MTLYSNVPVRQSQIDETTFSDHYTLKLEFDIFHEIVQNLFEFRSLNKLDEPLFCENFLFYLSHSFGNISEQYTNAETYLDSIVQQIKESTNKYFPSKQVKRLIPKKSWLIISIKRHITNRDRLYQIWIRSKARKDYGAFRKKTFEVNVEINFAKRIEDIIERNNTIEFFNFIKEMKRSATK